MTATVATLGERALRRLGVAIVAVADRPAGGATVTASEVAAAVLLELGIVVPESLRPDTLGPVSPADIAARALRAVGVNPISGSTTDIGGGTGSTGTVPTVSISPGVISA